MVHGACRHEHGPTCLSRRALARFPCWCWFSSRCHRSPSLSLPAGSPTDSSVGTPIGGHGDSMNEQSARAPAPPRRNAPARAAYTNGRNKVATCACRGVHACMSLCTRRPARLGDVHGRRGASRARLTHAAQECNIVLDVVRIVSTGYEHMCRAWAPWCLTRSTHSCRPRMQHLVLDVVRIFFTGYEHMSRQRQAAVLLHFYQGKAVRTLSAGWPANANDHVPLRLEACGQHSYMLMRTDA